ncbi:MAG: winged helix-turn-helix domain-containing protein [Jatrophihabitans sp.]
MPTSPTPHPVHDPRTLRAFAHPSRTRILDEISARGSMRAADIARELDIPANQASFHLRQLAKYGLIEEDADAARDRRDRVWRLVSPHGYLIALSELEQQPGGKAVTTAFRRTAREWGHVVVDAAYADANGPDTKRTVTDVPLRLTKSEAVEFASELQELTGRWQSHTREATSGQHTYTFLGVLVPRPTPS